jgi:hypothetical protein
MRVISAKYVVSTIDYFIRDVVELSQVQGGIVRKALL